MKGKRRYDLTYKFLRVTVPPYLSHKFNYEYDNINVEYSPYIVVSNHLTNWDPLFVGSSFKKSMYYVASDHILRMGIISKIIKFLGNPIPRLKSMQETQTVIAIFKRLREKCNICLFVEGSTSFDGKTGEIQPSIGKLIKKAGAALVTYRLSGAYLSYPRWARFVHKGKIYGKLVQIYSPDQLKEMSAEEIHAAIKNDLYVNAYEDQKENPVIYTGKQPAEYLETALYMCPRCRRFSTLKSNNDRLFCACGFHVRYNEYGYFEIPDSAEAPPFRTILEWSEWQRKEIETIAHAMKNMDSKVPIFSDSDQAVYQITRASHNIEIARGTLSFFNNRMSLIDESGEIMVFPLETITEISCITLMTLIFTTREQKTYEIHSNQLRSALKFIEMFNAWQTEAAKNIF